MLKNDNGAILTRMAKRSLVCNKGRYGIMIFAILLSSFLLFTILTVGVTWFQMKEVQDIRMQGGNFDAMLYGGFTEEQLEACKENPDIAVVGVDGFGAWAESTDRDATLHSVLTWADENKWEKIQNAAREWTRGSYPTKDNEVMATRAALEDCGYGELDIGDSFTLTYADNTGSHTAEFTISGMWDGYGDKNVFYVTKSFFEHTGFTLEDYGRGFLYVKFKSAIVTERMRRQLEEDLNLDKRQAWLTAESENSVRLLAGMAGLIAVTCLCAYLLIYNILYLSVSGNVRYYGLLQTVGMTGRQIYGMVQRQMLLVGAIGIGSGILLGAAVSFFVIPQIVKTLGIRQEEIAIAFHPAIFIFTILAAGFTVYLGSRKPARIAAKISPVEALGYRRVFGKWKAHKSGRGTLLWKLAGKQLCKDKKKTAVVVLSLGVGLSVFLCLTTLIESQGAREIISNYMEADFIIKNDTMTMEEQSKWKPLIDEAFLESLEMDEGIQEIHPMYNAQIVIPWAEGFVDLWMRKFYDMWMSENYEDIIDDYKEHPENYYSYLTGITQPEFEYLNAALKEPLDEQKFLEGKTCILYQNALAMETDEVIGKNADFALFDEQQSFYRLQIAGITDDVYYANMLGTTPTLLVSDTFLKQIAENTGISKVSIFYKQEFDEEAEEKIKARIRESEYAKDFSFDSKLDEMKEVKKSQGNMMEIGIGITFILALIGILNYVNTVSGNIQSRQMEIAVMESVGMTEKQVKKLLVLEGILFAALSLTVAATAGLGVTYYLYQSMNYRRISFGIPVVPSLCMTLCVLLICVSIPLLSYRMIVGKKTVIERIRRRE